MEEVLLFVWLVWFQFFKFSLWECYKGEGQIWGYWEMSRTGVHGVKFPKIKYGNYVLKNLENSFSQWLDDKMNTC